MKKITSLLLALFVLAILPSGITRAVEDTNTPPWPKPLKAEERAERAEAREEMKTERAEIREERKESLEEMRQRKRGLIMRAFALRISHLENIAERIANRIEILKEKGVDTEEAEAYLEEAEESIETAKENAEKAKEAVEDKESIEVIKGHVLATKEALKEVHKNLSLAVQNLKAKIAEENEDEDEEDEDDNN